MTKEELLNNEFDGQRDLIFALCDFFGFTMASDKEKENWPYKSELFISIENLKGKKLFNKGKFIGFVEDCYFGKGSRGHSAVLIKSGTKEYSLTDSKIQIYNNFSQKNEMVDLHPSRKGIKFWSNGHILSEKDYKSLYYKTKEYRIQYEKSLNENLGTFGIKAPIQFHKIKEKISKTIGERYSVNWFLQRGCHYSAVTITMQEKYGVDNIFFSDEWQSIIHKYENRTSKLELEVIEFLFNEFGDSGVFCSYRDKKQASVIDFENKQTYLLDYLNNNIGLIVEVYGDYWHCNPSMYDKEFYHPQKNKNAYEVWEYDKNRIESIERLTNFPVFIIWEKDWRDNKNEVVQNLKKFIYENSQHKVN